MSKPQSSPEPSMEDILASIRKMISEEPSGQRPMPDQMGRTPFGEDLRPVQEPDTWSAEPAAPVDAPLAASFSSLSQALRSAAPPGEHRSFEERIAGLIEDEEPDTATSSAPEPDPLLTFTARSNPTPAAPTSAPPAPRAPSPSVFDQRPGTARAPGPQPAAPVNGMGVHPASKFSDLGGTIPERSDALPGPRADAKPAAGTSSAKDEAPLPFGAKSESQRVISIPQRGAGAPAPGLNGAAASPEPKNGSVNGASVSPLGSRPAAPSLSPVTRSLQERLKERKPVELPKIEVPKVELPKVDLPKIEPKSEPLPEPRFEPKIGEKIGDKIADKIGDLTPLDKVEAKPEPTPAPKPDVTPSAPSLSTPATAPAPSPAPASVSAPAAGAEPSSPLSGAKAAIANAAPSEALVDAMVDLVQKDPGSMSVFTSGSAFIHGIGAKDSAPAAPAPGQKLDHTAAELLRPMLRQWLAENMPRIVEEALRSELTSGQEPEKDPKKS